MVQLPESWEDDAASKTGEGQLWSVEEEYRITPDNAGDTKLIVPVGDRRRSRLYHPFSYPELSGRFAELREGDEVGTLEFVKKWGLLGYRNLFVNDSFRVAGQGHLSGSELIERQAQELKQWGDPLAWVWWHSTQVQMLLELMAVLKGGDTGRIEDYVERLMPDNELKYFAGVRDRRFSLGQANRGPAQAAAEIIRTIINSNTEDYLTERLHTTDFEQGRLRSYHSFSSLLTVIYAHLRNSAIGMGGYYQCAYRYCSRWWPVELESRGPKRRYCPPEYGYTESQCARRERYQIEQERKERGQSRQGVAP